MDEAAWSKATIINLAYENEPGQGVQTPVKTLAFLYEDGTHLHIAIKAFDPSSKEIRANLRERDNLWLDDNAGIIVDTFNDQRSGFGFFVNPLGAQADFSIQELDDEDDSKDHSWDSIWRSAGKINDSGYIIEMSIPFRALRFPAGGHEQVWNIAVKRNIPRKHLTELSNYREDKNRKCTLCQYEPLLGFKGIKASKNIQVTPTLTLGRTDKKDVVTNADWQQGDLDSEVGMDLRWGISQNLVLNATVNPDFSQVETDAAQLDINNTYSLFYEEKRPFFLDGADYLTTPLFNLVHTRNIANPNYGSKLTGKSGLHRYGFLIADDNQTSFLIPGNQGSDLAETAIESTAIVGRYRVDMGKQNNQGILVTSRNGDDYHNHLLAVDGVFWLNSSGSVNYQLAHSDTRNPQQILGSFDLKEEQKGQAYLLSINHQTKTLFAAVSVEQVTDGFRADLGFQEKADFKEVSLTGGRTWYSSKAQKGWTEFLIYSDWDKSWDLKENLLEEEFELYANIKGTMQSTVELGFINRNSLYDGKYYREQQVTGWLELTPVSGFELSMFARFGDQIDYANAQLGERFKISPSVNWQLNQNLQVEAEYDYSYLDVEGGELYSADVLSAKFIWQFDSRNQLRLIAQHTDIERNLELYSEPEYFDSREKYFTTQLLYSYKVNPQTLFFLGYSDNGFQDDEQEYLIRSDRTLFAKFSYAWLR